MENDSTCRDCGERFDSWQEHKTRLCICDACWERRGALIEAKKAGHINMLTFTDLQQKLVAGNGTAKTAIEIALAIATVTGRWE